MIITALLVVSDPAFAQLDKVLKGLSGGAESGGLGDAKIGSGLKEALKVGTQNAVIQTSRVDGFFKNQAIKILMPKSLQSLGAAAPRRWLWPKDR